MRIWGANGDRDYSPPVIVAGDSPVKTVPVDEGERRLFCLDDAQIEELARQGVAAHVQIGSSGD